MAVITGGNSGIGRGIATHWVRNGGKVVLAARRHDRLLEVERELRDIGGEVGVIVCDVTREEDNQALARFAVEKFGGINLVVPAAGVVRNSLMLRTDRATGMVAERMTLADFQMLLDVNLNGVFLTVRECAEKMIDGGCKGLICLISSVGASGAAGQISYASAKAAISVMPKVITAEFFRRDIGQRIRCVAVAPGAVATPLLEGMGEQAVKSILDQVPIKRLIEPEEVASLIAELYRNEALAGEVFHIHGGLRFGSRG